MPFLQIKDAVVHVAISPCYQYNGFVFEVHPYLGPTKLRNSDHEPAARTGRKFWAAYSEWEKLIKKQKDKTRI
jgi:hypothetical protein